ncbi:MAG: hypothetical protein H6737_05395 [Alphaproteobacteria bacterium]|nr:hypothetical protein [Alphaproteobacteria bacterium]
MLPLLVLPALADPATASGEVSDAPLFGYVLGHDPHADRTFWGGSHSLEPVEFDREAFGTWNQPAAFHPELVGANVVFDPTITSGRTDWGVFPSSWWPMDANGVADRWFDADEPSPTEKYDLLFTPDDAKVVAEVTHWFYDELLLPPDQRPPPHTHARQTVPGPATKWELKNHGVYQDVHPDDWWGHCNGLAAYTTAEPLGFPTRAITVRLDADGRIEECAGEDEPGCVHFRKGDLEALFIEVWFGDSARMGGQRCDLRPDEIETDEYGRPVDAECRDLNPGTFHAALTHLLGRGAEHLATGETGKVPFVVDFSYDWEVWNFPVVGFELVAWERVDEAAASALVGAPGTYTWNPSAVSWARVEMRFEVLTDPVGTGQMGRTADNREFSYTPVATHYVLELDAADRILGGEWIEAPTVNGPDSRRMHPDFLWIATDHAAMDEKPNDMEGTQDNPFLSHQKLAQLLECANDPPSCAPGAEPTDFENIESCGCDGTYGLSVPIVGALVLLGLVGRRRLAGS